MATFYIDPSWAGPFKRSKPTIGAWEIANRDPTNRNPRE